MEPPRARHIGNSILSRRSMVHGEWSCSLDSRRGMPVQQLACGAVEARGWRFLPQGLSVVMANTGVDVSWGRVTKAFEIIPVKGKPVKVHVYRRQPLHCCCALF